MGDRGCPPTKEARRGEMHPSVGTQPWIYVCDLDLPVTPPPGTAVLEVSAKPQAREKLLHGQQTASVAPLPMAPSYFGAQFSSLPVESKLSDLIPIQSRSLSLCLS